MFVSGESCDAVPFRYRIACSRILRFNLSSKPATRGKLLIGDVRFGFTAMADQEFPTDRVTDGSDG